jgi:CRP-like cAMP-binding protein
MSLCVHIFGNVLLQAPFLSWMKTYPAALKKLSMRTKSLFRHNNDILFSLGEVDQTVYMLVRGWVALSLGSLFESQHTDVDEAARLMEESEPGQPDKIAVSRRVDASTVDPEVLELNRRAAVSGEDVFKEVRMAYDEGGQKVRKDKLARGYTKIASDDDLAFLQAPAFFGENVLWYTEPPPRMYSAKCLTRAEFATVTKEDIEFVVDELPYARKAYESFRDHIISEGNESMRSQGGERGKSVFKKVVPKASESFSPTSPSKEGNALLQVEEIEEIEEIS